MEEFPSNARRPESREPEQADKKLEKVVTGDVTRAKPSLAKKFGATFMGGDARTAWSSVVFDVLVPALKDMATDAVTQGIERMIYGDGAPRVRGRSASRYGAGTYTSYNRISTPTRQGPTPRSDEPRVLPKRSRSTHNFDDVILETRAEAEEVLDRMFDLISEYNVATVSDLYELLGITGAFTDEKWGWSDLRGTKVVRHRDGYLIDLPRPEAIQ